ncbi:MAG: zinc ABC transporter substrate-binding protein [Syntrophorhabdaceae bacterium]|nr:zinc ABC transporter substrate-binding protein [Syntrophorhabdaceae bacterium]
MRIRTTFFLAVAATALAVLFAACSDTPRGLDPNDVRVIVTSDTILSGMIASLMPSHRYCVAAVLPPGQCPGHYDVKLSDIEKIKRADLVVSFKGMPFMDKTGSGVGVRLFLDTEGRNWMAPDSYVHGLNLLADRLSEYYPEERNAIMSRKKAVIEEVRAYADTVTRRIGRAGLTGAPIISSSMLKEPLEWLGFRVVGEYGRPEAMSARQIVRLSKIARENHIVFVADNLQSGPDAGKGIADSLGTPHVVLTNFPSERGYLATLGENVDAILAAAVPK